MHSFDKIAPRGAYAQVLELMQPSMEAVAAGAGVMKGAIKEHEAILSALQACQYAEAKQLIQEHLQRLGWAQPEAAVGRDHQHRPVLHLGLLLQKPIGLRCQAMVKAWIRVHLHFKQHHWELWAAGFGAAGALSGPEHTVQAVAELLDL